MSLRARLWVAFGAAIIVALVPAVYGVTRLAELRDIAFDLSRRHAAAFLGVGRLQTSLAELNRLQRSYIVAPSEEARSSMYAALERAEAEVTRLEDTGYEDAAAEQARRVADFRDATVRIDSLMRGGAAEAATTYFQQVKPLYGEAEEVLGRVADRVDRLSTADAQRAQEIASRAAGTTGLALAIGLILALGVGVLAVGMITRPLHRLRGAMAAVAGGRFVSPSDLPYRRSDEVGDLARSFRSMTRQLAELDRVKAEFVSIASHELKTPVSVVQGYAEMLEDGVYGPANERQVEILEYIRQQTDVLTERVNQLLSLSRFEAGGLEVSPDRVSLRELVDDLHRAFDALASQRDVGFRVEVDPGVPETVHLDPERVRHELLGNVLSNAFKFTPAGGEVRLVVSAEGEGASFRISDTGEGIPPEQLPYVFEKFYQAGNRAGKIGTGLGLAIAREMAEAHGGRIGVESEPGRGTTFRIWLPADARPFIRARDGGPGSKRREGTRGPPPADAAEADADREQVGTGAEP